MLVRRYMNSVFSSVVDIASSIFCVTLFQVQYTFENVFLDLLLRMLLKVRILQKGHCRRSLDYIKLVPL
jgi:hypothetical protein